MQGNRTQIQYGVDLLDAVGGDNSNSSRNNNIDKLHTKRQVRGAAAAGGIAGLCFGPVGAVIGAGGAALVATSKGHAGDAFRASGDVMADIGVKLKRMDRKYHVVEKTSKSVVKGCHWISRRLKDDNNNNKGTSAASTMTSQQSRQ